MRPAVIGAAGGVRLNLRVTPKSSRDAFIGIIERAGEKRLAIKVRAAPHDGEANAAIVRLIAKSFQCAPSSVSIATGAKDRDKTVLISGARLNDVAAWLDGLGRNGETD